MKLLDVCTTIRYFGIWFVILSVWYRLARKTPFFKRKFPTTKWDNLDLASFIADDVTTGKLSTLVVPDRFFALHGSGSQTGLLDKITNVSDIVQSANEIINGNFKYFCNTTVPVKQPVNWHLNPFNGAQSPAEAHWCDLSCFVKDRGDIKSVWELSRFGWAYELVRAYLVNGDPKYAETFWELFDQWLEGNQPNRGVNWQCGQECALRVMTWCFALFGYRDVEPTTEERIKKMFLALAVHGERIEKYISDAVRQKTNHAITEAMGLYTIGILFPFFKKAQRWKNLGKKVLEREGFRQIYKDGSYVQQSMNYHRLMLHTYLWCLRLAELNGDSFSDELKGQLLKATEFLYQMQDDSTGRTPNYGANDGAIILPLNSCYYLDYRAVIQACWYLLKREKLYKTGPWDEDLLWLFGPDALGTSRIRKQRTSSEFAGGGYYTLRGKSSWAMIRCHTYRDRVGHVDPLHLDLWADGMNLLRDCGSYKYFDPDEPELERYFKSIWAHNTVIVDDSSPLRLVSRFIYLPWPKAEMRQFEKGEACIKWKGTHFAYNRSPWHVVHCRQVIVDRNDRWVITDQLLGKGQHKLELRWNLPKEAKLISKNNRFAKVRLPSGWLLEVEGQDKISVNLLISSSKGGWESLFYSHKRSIPTLSVSVSCQLPRIFKTILRKEAVE